MTEFHSFCATFDIKVEYLLIVFPFTAHCTVTHINTHLGELFSIDEPGARNSKISQILPPVLHSIHIKAIHSKLFIAQSHQEN